MEANRYSLTSQELEAAHNAGFNLGAGYPQIPLPGYITGMAQQKSINESSFRLFLNRPIEEGGELNDSLNFAVRSFLNMPHDQSINLFSTFSGSVALDRSLAAVQLLARTRGKRRIVVITTSPSIDIIQKMLEEHREIHPIFVESRFDGRLGALDPHAIVKNLQMCGEKYKSSQITVMLTSPENPTGSVWSGSDLRVIADACAAADAMLVLDHCFAVAGIHEPIDVPLIWNEVGSSCRWIAIWDTGKTFGLNEEKVGFLISQCQEISDAIESALAVIQFRVARRSKELFAAILRVSLRNDYVGHLRNICISNLSTLDRLLGDKIMRHPTDAGSLAFLDVSRIGQTDEEIRKRLRDGGVGVVSGNVFFHTKWRPTNYIRVSLARSEDYFDEAIHRMRNILRSD